MARFPLDLRSIRLARAPWARALRALFLALAVLAVLPTGLVGPEPEVAADGCAADCADCGDHGCAPASHHCRCCPSAATVPGEPAAAPVLAAGAPTRAPWSAPSDRARWRPVEPPVRPPIA